MNQKTDKDSIPTVFVGQKKMVLPDKPGKYKYRVISDPQRIRATCINEQNNQADTTIVVNENEKQSPVLDILNDSVSDKLTVQQYKPVDFLTVKPLNEKYITINMEQGQDNLAVTLPQEFFQYKDPIKIFYYNRMISDYSFTTLPDSAIPSANEKPDLDNSLPMTEVPAETVANSGLNEGAYNLDDVYDNDDFVKSLCNNLFGGGAGSGANNYELLEEFFPGKKFYIKQYNGKYYVVFKGMAGARKTIKGTRYLLKNPKVMSLSAAKSPGAGAGAALKGFKSVKNLKGNVLTMVIIGTVDLVAWQKGILSDDGKFISDLIIEFGMDVAKAVVSSVVAGFIVGAGCMGLAFIGVTSLPVVIVVGAGIVISIGIGMLLDYVDEEVEVTKRLKNKGNEVEKSIIDTFEEISDDISNAICQFERNITWWMMRGYKYYY